MACNCEGKQYNVSMGCCEPVLAPIQNYYTKYQIDKMIEEIESGITSGCCITPEEVDEKIYLFPAWPRDWDVRFKLHASRHTTVEAELKDGKVVHVKVNPSARQKDLVY